MVDKTASEEVIKIINQFLDLVRANHIPFEQVYLYGSYAKGNPDADSDIDLAIVAKEWKPDIFEAQFELMKIGRKVDTRLEPHPFCKSDFDMSNPYVREIITTGNLLN
ncbi:MAG: nucleotidyltransferase domain-containing protein [bacterium]